MIKHFCDICNTELTTNAGCVVVTIDVMCPPLPPFSEINSGTKEVCWCCTLRLLKNVKEDANEAKR